MVPATHYDKSGDIHIAYQVVGEGPVDLVLISGRHLLEQFELFPCLLRVEACDPCDISTWPLQCLGESDSDRIDHTDEYDRNL